jgi:hypothetical protein
MPRPPLAFTCLLTVAAVLATAGPTRAADPAPTPAPVVRDKGPDASDGSIPKVSPVLRAPRAIVHGQRPVATAPPGDKGSTLTDEGLGEAMAKPNELEQMKLDRARQAVEASRAAGILFNMSAPTPRIALSKADLEEEKVRALERLKTAPRTKVHHPDAGVGDLAHPRQESGSGELSALERQKLEAFLRGETFIGPPPPPAKPRAAAPKVDAGRTTKEGQ